MEHAGVPPAPSPDREGARTMADVVFLLLIVAFFAVTALVARRLDRR